MVNIPTFTHYMNPIIEALKTLGGSSTNQEMFEQVVSDMNLSDEQLSVIHDPESGDTTEVGYRMAWARTYLKKEGYLENSSRGVWVLTQKGREAGSVDPQEIARLVRAKYEQSRPESTKEKRDGTEDVLVEGLEEEDDDWREALASVLKDIPPDAFERLAQRLLRECGFMEVEVTGKVGDGGIDGIGVLRMHDVVSFHVVFQCKRWQGSVGSREIRDFRGSMAGRSDKGVFITTGTFTRDAQKEATRDGAPPVDLIDGEQLADLLKKFELGIKSDMVERVSVDAEWYKNL